LGRDAVESRGITIMEMINAAWMNSAMGNARAFLLEPISLLKKESLKISGISSLGFGFIASAIFIPHAPKFFRCK
jgi:hypothetical protein